LQIIGRRINPLDKKTERELRDLMIWVENKRFCGQGANLGVLHYALARWAANGRKDKIAFLTEEMGVTVPEKPIKIDIGCGVRKKDGFIGIDFMGFNGVDIIVDLTKERLPFKENSVDEVWSNHFLEHLVIEDVCKVMEEIHRVCKHWAYVEIRVPHFSGLTNFYEFHKTSFRYNSFAEFTLGGGGMFNSEALFYLESTKINIVNRQSPKLRPHTKWLIWNYPIEWIVNKMPLFYELTGFRSLFPAWEVIFKMRVIK
jgi:hypothetical protein